MSISRRVTLAWVAERLRETTPPEVDQPAESPEE